MVTVILALLTVRTLFPHAILETLKSCEPCNAMPTLQVVVAG
jgi:hypothetical protein